MLCAESQIQQEKANLKEQERRFELRLSKEHELLQAAELDADRLNAETQQLRIKKVRKFPSRGENSETST